MTSEDFTRVEQELAVSLPEAYREVLQRPEFQGEAAGFQEFSSDADEIIGLNLEVRQGGFAGTKWPPHYFVLGDDGAGNYYFSDLKRTRPAVFLADHELTMGRKRLSTSETYETFPDFISFVLRLQSETDAAFEESGPKPVAPKPWWKRW